MVQGGLADHAVGPDVLQEFVPADDTIAVLDEIEQEIKDLRFERARDTGVPEFVEPGVKDVVPKVIHHGSLPKSPTVHRSLREYLKATHPGTNSTSAVAQWLARHGGYYHTKNFQKISRKSSADLHVFPAVDRIFGLETPCGKS
jgi:hypothetical protein